MIARLPHCTNNKGPSLFTIQWLRWRGSRRILAYRLALRACPGGDECASTRVCELYLRTRCVNSWVGRVDSLQVQ